MSAIPHDSVLEIRPSAGWRAIDLREIWQSRELLFFLIWRDLKARYRQTVLGATWVVIQPLASMAIYTLVFGKVARIPSNGIPYPIFVYTAILIWSYFANAVAGGSNSVVSNANLITKVYFPRLIIPTAGVVTGLVDSAIALLVLLPLMIWYGVRPAPSALFVVPLLYIVAVLLALGLSLVLTALNVRYRDVRNIVPFLLQLWMYATPVVYPLSLVPAKYRWLVALNPMTGIVEAFRSVLVGRPIVIAPLFVSGSLSLLAVAAGGLYFRRAERSFADIV